MSEVEIKLTQIPVSENDISTNLQVGVIVVSEDKLVRILERDRERTKKNLYWITPLGILVSLIIAILTTDFKNRWGLPAETWSALFYIAGAISSVWIIVCLFKIKNVKIEKLIEEIKGK